MMLEKERQFYLEHQAELIAKYKGKHIVLKGDEVIGVYETAEDAYFETVKSQEPGTFYVQHCVEEKDEDKFVFHSRVVFA